MFLEDPYEKIEKFRREMDKIFNKYLKEIDIITTKGGKVETVERARVNIKKTKNAFEYQIEVPGVDKEDIEVNIVGNILEIKARKRIEKKQEKGFIYIEIIAQEFYRALPLPEDADIKKVKAKYENGILKLIIGRTKKKNKGKKVKVE